MGFDSNFYDYVLGRSGSVLGNLLGSMSGSPLGSGVNFDQLGQVLHSQQQQGAADRLNKTGQPGQAGQGQPPAGHAPTATGAAPVPGHDSFMETSLPLALQVQDQTGVPAILSLAVAANETGHGTTGGAPWNSFHGIRGTGPAGQTPGGFRAYNNAGESYADFGKLLTDPNSVYAGAWAQYQQTHDPKQLLQGIAQAGYASNKIVEGNGRTEAQNWVDQVGRLIDYADQVQSAHQRGQVSLQGTSQYDLGLPRDVADAFCGPSAAIEFVKYTGRTPTVMEAMNLAKESGWTQAAGMAGPQSEVNLLNRLGVPAYMAAPDPQKIASEIQAGRPVIINTSGHYYQVTGYNQATGTFTFGDAVGRKAGNVGTTIDGLSQYGFGAPDAAIYMGVNGGPQ